MDIETRTPAEEPSWIPTPISLRADQRAWLDQEKIRQRHGNRSRIVQEALDLYRRTIEVERQMKGVA